MKIPSENSVQRRRLEQAGHPAPVLVRRGARAKPTRRRLSLALQGGGSFGAFTWGVLDRLLESEDIAYDAVSGASAGAVNAVLLASGLREGGPEAAKVRLARFWRRASEAAPRARAGMAVALAARVLSPYQFNPFNLHPLRTILSKDIDFDALRDRSGLRLLIAATRVRDGRLRIFREKAVTLDVILASTCLPLLHHAVTINGEAYWDGGYTANPPLFPLVSTTRASDALVVQIMPSVGLEMPTSPAEISRRMEQITFNSSLVREMEALAAMTKLAANDSEGSRLSGKLQKLRIHHISAETEFPKLSQSSALNLDWEFLIELRDAGRRAADRWLVQFRSGG
ncbi:patatin-like phospholipase family protein [Microvirga massiliensis]|uniref:patatin-like phospholipase family protein n=1 Tax=Microvirga massiliensis TaxID=1033741 RepID=UPI000B0C6888|nr:patatin-like phospholipase family protein [Microvirga massiliensis]